MEDDVCLCYGMCYFCNSPSSLKLAQKKIKRDSLALGGDVRWRGLSILVTTNFASSFPALHAPSCTPPTEGGPRGLWPAAGISGCCSPQGQVAGQAQDLSTSCSQMGLAWSVSRETSMAQGWRRRQALSKGPSRHRWPTQSPTHCQPQGLLGMKPLSPGHWGGTVPRNGLPFPGLG